MIEWGERSGRLTAPLFALMEAADGYNRAAQKGLEGRVAWWGSIQQAIARVAPDTIEDDYTRSLTVYQAGSFSLDIDDRPGRISFDPILMSRSWARSLEDNAPVGDDDQSEPGDSEGLVDAEAARLLNAEDHRAFLGQFEATDDTRRAYSLRRTTHLLLDPDLQRALNVVRKVRLGSEDEKRAFISNPRAAIATALGLDGGDALSTALFVETWQYSERVLGLGAWIKPDLSWLSKARTDWLPERFPVVVNGREVEIGRDDIERLRQDVITAEAEGSPTVSFQGADLALGAAQTLFDQVGLGRAAIAEDGIVRPDAEGRPASTTFPEPAMPVVVQIKRNFEGVAYVMAAIPRHPAIPLTPPAGKMGRTSFKLHQEHGFKWLVDAWTTGWPGVLLADDMGLGKTFQSLAFLAWVRADQEARPPGRARLAKRPMLIVAPTALLENWVEEMGKHLAPGALGGELAKVFGPSVRLFRNTSTDKAASFERLDREKIAQHDIVLTTYETLADNHIAFSKIEFSVALFDEIQKIKDPGTLNANAAGAINADFVLGLTGTPIENRIEDLWSIMDRVMPGQLRDLRTFSSNYRDDDLEKYRLLSDQLLKSQGGAPPIILRRMKGEHLKGLPSREYKAYPTDMPEVQARAYGEVVAEAVARTGQRAPGAMLEVIQRLRGISLFPGEPDDFDLTTESGCRSWIAQSARLARSFEIFRGIDRLNEKVLVFVDTRRMQALMALAMATVFGIDPPVIINGTVPGGARQKRVNDFQAKRPGFDAMILSPKAAGVGLTITAANHVLHLSRWWNPAVEDQCNDRVYRIGQQRDVTVHIPMAVHPQLRDRTFDVTLNALLERKRRMSQNLLAPPVRGNEAETLMTDLGLGQEGAGAGLR
ncbi:RNA polymerase-associated protein RapA [Methylobacterium jeotgali]|uniref:RNA polymerase-associated protein RapA n=9 Tax=Pseudomonadota TaxID=1224 RepID=A0ABQ4SRY2_9HYPH|nr:RNA polymerase-associated protein RapA [Methylobacterium jeotgali]